MPWSGVVVSGALRRGVVEDGVDWSGVGGMAVSDVA